MARIPRTLYSVSYGDQFPTHHTPWVDSLADAATEARALRSVASYVVIYRMNEGNRYAQQIPEEEWP